MFTLPGFFPLTSVRAEKQPLLTFLLPLRTFFFIKYCELHPQNRKSDGVYVLLQVGCFLFLGTLQLRTLAGFVWTKPLFALAKLLFRNH